LLFTTKNTKNTKDIRRRVTLSAPGKNLVFFVFLVVN